MVEVKQSFYHSEESFKYPQDLAKEAKYRASIQQALCQFSVSTFNIKQAPDCNLDNVGEGMLQEWYQPSQHTIWIYA